MELDLAGIPKFEPPDGHLLLAFEGDLAFGITCLRRMGPDTQEIKRMYVEPSHRRGGVGREMFARLIALAATDGYQWIRLDSPDFLTAAHDLYRSAGFTDRSEVFVPRPRPDRSPV